MASHGSHGHSPMKKAIGGGVPGMAAPMVNPKQRIAAILAAKARNPRPVPVAPPMTAPVMSAPGMKKGGKC